VEVAGELAPAVLPGWARPSRTRPLRAWRAGCIFPRLHQHGHAAGENGRSARSVGRAPWLVPAAIGGVEERGICRERPTGRRALPLRESPPERRRGPRGRVQSADTPIAAEKKVVIIVPLELLAELGALEVRPSGIRRPGRRSIRARSSNGNGGYRPRKPSATSGGGKGWRRSASANRAVCFRGSKAPRGTRDLREALGDELESRALATGGDQREADEVSADSRTS